MNSMNDQGQILSRNYGGWAKVPLPPLPPDPVKFQGQPWMGFAGRNVWKGKKAVDKRKEIRRKEKRAIGNKTGCCGGGGGGGGAGGGGYKPPTLNELQSQNRLKARRFYPKKKFTRFAPFAPRNTTSFLIRAKKAGGIASLVSPCPVTPAILPTPMFSPTPEVLVDMAREEWGVDGYGSMNGLIRLRSPGQEVRGDDEEEEEGESTDSDVEEHVEVERRLDHDLSRFEMIYPNNEQVNVDEQDSHITQLEEENLTLKERLYLMEREMVDLRRRLQRLETESRVKDERHDEESENEGGGDVCSEKSVGAGD